MDDFRFAFWRAVARFSTKRVMRAYAVRGWWR